MILFVYICIGLYFAQFEQRVIMRIIVCDVIFWESVLRFVYFCTGVLLVIFVGDVSVFDGEKSWSGPGSNRGPSACKADMITTTPPDREHKYKIHAIQ